MNIEKGKIHELYQYGENKVFKYTQVIENKDLNEKILIEGKTLGLLKSKVRDKMYEWIKWNRDC